MDVLLEAFSIRPVIYLAVCAHLAGCSFNSWGTSSIQYFQNETSDAMLIRSCGIHVSGHAVDRGVTFGCTNRLYMCPKDDGASASNTSIENAAAETEQVGPTNSKLAMACLDPNNNAPTFLFASSTGLGLDSNSFGLGAFLGHRSRFRQAIPRTCNTVVHVRVSREDPENNLFKTYGDTQCIKR